MTPQDNLNKRVDETVESIMGFAEALMEEYESGRLPKSAYELGFNLKVCICMYYGKTLEMRG